MWLFCATNTAIHNFHYAEGSAGIQVYIQSEFILILWLNGQWFHSTEWIKHTFTPEQHTQSVVVGCYVCAYTWLYELMNEKRKECQKKLKIHYSSHSTADSSNDNSKKKCMRCHQSKWGRRMKAMKKKKQKIQRESHITDLLWCYQYRLVCVSVMNVL